MKTISLIAVSTLLGCAVSGQMIPLSPAEVDSDFHPSSNDQEISAPPILQPDEDETEPEPESEPVESTPDHPEYEHSYDPSPPPPPPPTTTTTTTPQVVHITKTRTQIVYPRPNEWRWKNLPTLPFHKHKGKIVAEFYVDGNGHYREIKHGRHPYSRYSHHWNEDEYIKFGKDGMHPHGKVVYGGPWTGPPPHKHKGSYDNGKQDYYHHQHGKNIHGEHRKYGNSSHHDDDKKKDYLENYENTNSNLNETDSQGGKNKNDWKKKTAEGYQAKGIEGIVAQNNTAAPNDASVSGSASAVSVSVSASASRGASGAAAGGAQKTPAAGSASSMAAGASAKNAAATSSAHPSSASAKPSGSMTTSATNAGANTRQVALSFVAAIAATAVWWLA